MENEKLRRSFHTPFQGSPGLAIYRSGLQRYTPDHSWGPGVCNHYLIHYILSEKGTFDSGKRKYALSAGDGFLMVPGVISSYQADHNEPWEYRWADFNGADASRLVRETGLSEESPLFRYGQDNAMESMLSDIYTVARPNPSNEVQVTTTLLRFLAALMVLHDDHNYRKDTGYAYVQRSIQLIDLNYPHEDLDVTQVAANMGIGRGHLYRLFLRHTGMTPNEYLTKYRINKTTDLLKNENLSVGETTYFSGFSDQLYFSRVFRELKGVPPSKFAESARKVEKE